MTHWLPVRTLPPGATPSRSSLSSSPRPPIGGRSLGDISNEVRRGHYHRGSTVKSRGKNFPVTARLETRMLGAGDGGLIKGGRPFRRLGVDRQADSEHGLRASPSDSLLRSRRASFGRELPSTLDLPVWLVVTMCGE